LDLVKQSIEISNQYRRKTTLTESFGRILKRTDYNLYTEGIQFLIRSWLKFNFVFEHRTNSRRAVLCRINVVESSFDLYRRWNLNELCKRWIENPFLLPVIQVYFLTSLLYCIIVLKILPYIFRLVYFKCFL
jgi:hypothetical protein